jgi:hypothetical protein
MRRLLSWVGVLALAALLVASVAGPERRRQACAAIGLCEDPDLMGAMLVSVQRQQKLMVLTARLVAPVTSARDTTIGPLAVASTRQTTILPATVTYVVDLSALAAADLKWDADRAELRVRRPQVKVMEPTIDWGRAQTYGDRGWATALTDVAANLQRDNAAKAPALFRQQAAAPELMAMADHAADQALATLFRMPLAAAGFGQARVIVTS